MQGAHMPPTAQEVAGKLQIFGTCKQERATEEKGGGCDMWMHLIHQNSDLTFCEKV